MAKRINVGGRYMNVRERNTSKGHRGTFMGNWSSKHKQSKSRSHAMAYFLALILGFIFGTMGLWVLTYLGRGLQWFQSILSFLMEPGKITGAFLANDAGISIAGLSLIYLVNGAFYAIIAALIVFIAEKASNK